MNTRHRVIKMLFGYDQTFTSTKDVVVVDKACYMKYYS